MTTVRNNSVGTNAPNRGAHADDAEIASRRASVLADLIATELTGVGPGHCVRVNYLDRDEAEAVCAQVRNRTGSDVDVFVLAGATSSDLAITSDRAIELRNRKLRPLCLFMPPDAVDAAASSLTNSFATIDGQVLYQDAFDGLLRDLPKGVDTPVQHVRQAFRTGRVKPSARDLVDFALAAEWHHTHGTLELLGLDLWRVGLVADAGDFVDRLPANKTAMTKLVRPTRAAASVASRIVDLGVDEPTARRLDLFFARRSPGDVRGWSRALLDADLTFDTWGFPDTDTSDLKSVEVTPYLDRNGGLAKAQSKSGLHQPDGPGAPLFIAVGSTAKLPVSWTSHPKTPNTIHGWRISMIPASLADDLRADRDTPDWEIDGPGLDLPSKDIKGTSRRLSLKLDLDPDELPETKVVVRVVAIDETGNEVRGENGQPIADCGDDFYLTARESSGRAASGASERRRTVPTLAEGRLRAAVDAKADVTAIELTQPSWAPGKGVIYFTASIDLRTRISIVLSPLLLALEKQTLTRPSSGGRWRLALDEVRPATNEEIASEPIALWDSPEWEQFHEARENFFARIRPKSRRRGVVLATDLEAEANEARDVIEVAEWTTEQVGAGLRYAQAYRALLQTCTGAALLDALSIDTLSVAIDGGNAPEPAVIILPTHPLRVAWLLSHASLFRHWEQMVLALPNVTARHRAIDLELARDLRPVNMPAFAYGAGSDSPFVFFRNVGFSHGVALPPDVPDPLRRYLELAEVLGFGSEPLEADDRGPERLAGHLDRFHQIHPYADPLQIALVNPDQGELIAGALERSQIFAGPRRVTDEEEETEAPRSPLLELDAFVLPGADATLTDLKRVRGRLSDRETNHTPDHLHPRLTTAVRDLADLGIDRDTHDLPAAHMAVISDLCRPSVRAAPINVDQEHERGVSLYGLIARVTGGFEGVQADAVGGLNATSTEGMAFRWRYRIANPTTQNLQAHPAGPRFSNALIELQVAILAATARQLEPTPTAVSEPVLDVVLGPDHVRTLEWLHDNTDWVVTMDRFFGIDFYDSPQDPVLRDLAEKHLLDYAPEFVDGLGQRMIVTTAWREEIQTILRRAMDEIGFASIEASVRRLLGALKTVSGRLALQALSPTGGAAQAVGLAAVISYLRDSKRLRRSILIPVDIHPDLFTRDGRAVTAAGQHRCDLLLVEVKRGTINLTFLEVKYRRAPLSGLETLIDDMRIQVSSSIQGFRDRFFNPERVDAALQRAKLTNILRFYLARGERYGLIDTENARLMRGALLTFERDGATVEIAAEGYVVSLGAPAHEPIHEEGFTVRVLTAADFERQATFQTTVTSPTPTSAPPSPPATKRDRPEPEPEPEPESIQLAKRHANTMQPEPRQPEPMVAVEPPAMVAKPDPIEPQPEPLPSPPMSKVEPDVTEAIPPAPNGSAAPESPPSPEPAIETPEAAVARDVMIDLGQTPSGDPVQWRPSVQGSPHLFITGIPGQGKSVTTRTLLDGLARQGVPALVFDFHGEYAEDVRQWAPANGPLSQPLVTNAAAGLPFSPFEAAADSGPVGWRMTAQAISEIFGFVADLGDIQRDTLMTSIRDAYIACGFEQASNGVTPRLPTLADVRARIEAAEASGKTRNLLARIRPLLELDLFRPPPDGTSDLQGALRGGLIVRLDQLGSEVAQDAVGAFLLRKVYRDMFGWGRARGLRLAVVLDEAHRLAKDQTLPKLLKEGRKYGVLAIAASQGLADFHPDVLNNVGTKVAFRANNPESRKIAAYFTPTRGSNLKARVEGLRVGHALVQTPEMSVAVVLGMRSSIPR